MQFTTAILAALAAATSLAAPAELTARADPSWTIVGLKRVCDTADTTCTWSFKIDTHLAAATTCSFTTKGKPASQAAGGPANCGSFTVTSGWSGQFGPGNGFTTLAIKNNANNKIIWPGYTDKQLVGGKVVSPDQSFPVTQL